MNWYFRIQERSSQCKRKMFGYLLKREVILTKTKKIPGNPLRAPRFPKKNEYGYGYREFSSPRNLWIPLQNSKQTFESQMNGNLAF